MCAIPSWPRKIKSSQLRNISNLKKKKIEKGLQLTKYTLIIEIMAANHTLK